MEVGISLKTLFDELNDIPALGDTIRTAFGNLIEKTEDNGNVYYDLYTPNGDGSAVLMDGETCTVVHVDEGDVVVIEHDGVNIELSKKEFNIATFK